MDYFIRTGNAEDRLYAEWEKYGKLVIAYDFDGTIFDYGNQGHRFNNVMDLLRRCKKLGFNFIVFTCREEADYGFIKQHLADNDLPYDKINENVDFIPFKGRKIYYNILLDDRAGLTSAYYTLLNVVRGIEREKRLDKNNSML